tara:strand:+ start:16361 stop:17167 length:807 start_codon:yes stop_codon:yes gene_type:complete
MKSLIDADVLLYECASVAEYPKDEPMKGFDFVKEVFDNRVRDIMAAVEADSCTLYLTGDDNFRVKVAVTKPYKGNRKAEKPFHYHNLKAYIQSHEHCVTVDGMEADDQMSIDQTDDTVICTRDKDLRMVPGWHYGWECGRQPEFKKTKVNDVGYVQITPNKKDIKGTGLSFFYAQLLVGDKTDNIPGLEGCGPVAAWDALGTRSLTPAQMLDSVVHEYTALYGDRWKERLTEQAQLLWMVREVDDEGKPVMWEYDDAVRYAEMLKEVP